jgi:hypothetical protein
VHSQYIDLIKHYYRVHSQNIGLIKHCYRVHSQNNGLIKHCYRVHSDPVWRSIVWYIPVHKTYMKRTLYRTGPNVWITGTRVLTRPRLARRFHTHVYLRKSHLYTSLNFFALLTRWLSKNPTLSLWNILSMFSLPDCLWNKKKDNSVVQHRKSV